jgi:hypothetical protein
MQKSAIRIISDANYNAHSEPFFKSLNILPFPKLILFFNLKIMQGFKNGFLPVSFNDVWYTNAVRRADVFEITLRNNDFLNIPFARLSMSNRMPLVNLPKTWENFTNEDIKILREPLEFHLKLKRFLLSELSDTVICNRLFCHACNFPRLRNEV